MSRLALFLVLLFMLAANPIAAQEDDDSEDGITLESEREYDSSGGGKKTAPRTPETEGAPDAAEPAPFLTLEKLLGRWAAADARFSMAIVPKDGALPGKQQIEAHTLNRVWKGNYVALPSEALAAELFYAPNADEMDPAIPLWARKEVDGDLEWQLKVFGRGPDHHPHLEVEWHRQQIKWDEKKKTAGIVEKGEPLKFIMHYAPIMKMTQSAPVMLGIFPVRAPDAQYSSSGLLSSVLQQQHFMVQLSAPFHLLKDLGRTVEVEIAGKDSGQKVTLTLEARAPPGENGQRIVYTNEKPIKLGSCSGETQYDPPTMGIEWFFNIKANGDCLPFKGEDGEIVSVRFGQKTEYRFQWWANWMSAAIAAHRDEIERRRITYNGILTSSEAAPADREISRGQLRMILNYDALMRSDLFTLQHKIAIGEIYLGGRGLSSYATYSGATYGRDVPNKGLLSFSQKEMEEVRLSRQVRWPSYEPGPYVDSLAHFSRLITWLPFIGTGNAQLGSRAVEVIPYFPEKDAKGKDITRPPHENLDATLQREIYWQHYVERLGVVMALSSVSAGLINDLSQSFFKQGTLVLYDGVAEESGAGYLFILADWVAENAPAIMDGLNEKKWPQLGSARNHRGERVDGWGIAQSGSLFMLNYSMPIGRAAGGFSTMRFLQKSGKNADQAASALPWRIKIGRVEQGENLYTLAQGMDGSSVILNKGDVLPADLPGNLSAPAKDLLAVEFPPASLANNKHYDVSPSGDVAQPGQVQVKWPVAAAKDGAKLDFTPKKSPDAAALTREYGPSASLQGPAGSLVPVQQADFTDGLISANYVIAKHRGISRGEAAGAAQMQQVLENAAGQGQVKPAAIYYFGHHAPYPEIYLNQYIAKHGIQGSALPIAKNKSARLIQAHLANENGWVVTARLDVGGAHPKQVVIDKIVLGAEGAPQKVTFFDPAYGALVEMDAGDFDALLARNANDSVFKVTRTNLPDAPKANAIPEPIAAPAPAAVRTPVSAPAIQPAGANPSANTVFSYSDKADPSKALVAPLGDKLGQGSFNVAFRHADDPNIVVRMNNPYDVTPPDDVMRAQVLDDAGRRGIEAAGANSSVIQGIPLYSSTTMPDGRRIELVGFARGEPAHKVLKKRAREGLSDTEAKLLDEYEEGNANRLTTEEKTAGKALKERALKASKFTPQEAAALARALHEMNHKGYVALDMHSHNFNFLYDGSVSGGVKIEVVDPGGIVQVKGLDPALARKAQEKIVVRSDADISYYNKFQDNKNFWPEERVAVMNEIKDDLDFGSLGTGNVLIDEDHLPFKPSLGLENPEVAQYFQQLR